MNIHDSLATLLEFQQFYDKDNEIGNYEVKEKEVKADHEKQLLAYRKKLADLRVAAVAVPDEKADKEQDNLEHGQL